MTSFTELLIKARESKHMTKTQVAKLFNWTPMYYGRYENGYLKPQGANIKKFADFIGITTEQLTKIIANNHDKK